MKFLELNSLTKIKLNQIRNLWNNEYPKILNQKSINDLEDYLSNLQDQHHVLIENKEGEIKGWLFDFVRDNERWFVLILDSSIQRKGYGKILIEKAKERNSTLNGWIIITKDLIKSNGEIYKLPENFYKKEGFKILYDTKIKSDLMTILKINWTK